jgi:type II secretory pathway pseudopilin PulG
MLFVAFIAIGAAAMLPEFTFQMKRDREEEMIHRGVQYSRAIRRYYKKFGKYPTTIEELKNTNHVHFLRKVYKDPVTGKDFRLLHLTDVQQLLAGAMVGGAPGTNAGMAGGGAGFRAMGQMAGPQGLGAGMAQQAAMAQASMAQAAMAMGQTSTQNPMGTPLSGNSPDSESKSSGTGPSSSSDKLSGQVFGGGPVVGVASTSKDETIREFNNKNHYKDWQFIYSPMMDRGGLITGPFQPSMGGLGGGNLQAGQNGVQGQPGQSAFGQSSVGKSSFGQSPSGQSSFGQSSFGQPPQQQAPQPTTPPDQP